MLVVQLDVFVSLRAKFQDQVEQKNRLPEHQSLLLLLVQAQAVVLVGH